MKEFLSAVGRGEKSWQQVLSVALGASDASVADSEQAVRDIKRFYTGRAMWGRATQGFGQKMGRALTLGPLQAVLPVQTSIGGEAARTGGGLLDAFAKTHPRAVGGLRGAGRLAGKAFRFLGPAMTIARISAGEPAYRVIPQEMGTWGGFEVGMVVGGAIGSAIGGPGVGTVAGMALGFVAAGIGGAVADAPMRFMEHLSDLGRRARRAELGGKVSAAGMTRAAWTMRSRSLEQINRSGINARSLLGREAVYQHMRAF